MSKARKLLEELSSNESTDDLTGDKRRNGTYLTKYHIDNFNMMWNHPDAKTRDDFQASVHGLMRKASNATTIDGEFGELYYLERLFNNRETAQQIVKDYMSKEYKRIAHLDDYLDTSEIEFQAYYKGSDLYDMGSDARTPEDVFVFDTAVDEIFEEIELVFKSKGATKIEQAKMVFTMYLMYAGVVQKLTREPPYYIKLKKIFDEHGSMTTPPSLTDVRLKLGIPDQFFRSVVGFLADVGKFFMEGPKDKS